MMKAEHRLLSGTVSDGMFPTERTIVFEDFEGNTVSVIASERLVIEDSDCGFVRVMLIEAQDESGRVVVLLPGDVYGAGQYAAVRASDLKTEAAA
ncbi:MAG: hypothetical protein F4X76_01035 [Chloroflexi bacterium]|nr:hypothetical protein [Chloroflexota bacterium]